MNKFIIAFLLFGACSNLLLSQTKDQAKQLAAEHIAEKVTYKHVVENGKPTGDSMLVGHSWYNALGYPLMDINFDTLRYPRYKTVNEYQDDSILLKTTFFKKGNVKTNETTKLYDAAGNHVKNINYFLYPRKALPDTTFFIIVYDSLNRMVEAYHDEGKGKTYSAKYDYDIRGNMVKMYHYGPDDRPPYINEMEYDDRNNMIHRYAYTGNKRKLTGENTFNALNQCVEKRTYYSRKVKKQFFNQRYTSKKKTENLVRYYYDARGLLSREEEYYNSILKGILVYRYLPKS